MEKKIYILLTGLLIFELSARATNVDTLSVEGFGKVNIYIPGNVPGAIVLLVSGTEGWNKEMSGIAQNIKAQGALVAGINLKYYLKQLNTSKAKCMYPAGDFESLSMDIQKKYKFKQYLPPILVGCSSGATFVYGVLAQSPPETFKGAISFGFSPEIITGNPLCEGNGLKSVPTKNKGNYYLQPCSTLKDPFVVLQGALDKVRTNAALQQYMTGLTTGELILLPDVGTNLTDSKAWLPRFCLAYNKILNKSVSLDKQTIQKTETLDAKPLSVKNDLPLTIIPSKSNKKMPLLFFISGDGGWKKFEQMVGEIVSEKGMPVIGLDALKYFWNERQPKDAADEISAVISYYMKQWDRSSFILVGYSFGAGVVPFIANNFPDQLKGKIKGVYCFSPDKTSDFEIHISDMLSMNTKEKYNVLNELKIIIPFNPVCIFGSKEDAKLKKQFIIKGIRIESLPGEHHYNNDYNAIAGIMLKDFL